MPIIRKIIQIGSFMVTLKQREVTTNLHSQELADLAESTFYQILIYCGWNVSRRLVTPVFVSLHIKFTIPKVLVQIALEKTSVFPLFQKKDHVANDNLVRRMTARWQSVRRQRLRQLGYLVSHYHLVQIYPPPLLEHNSTIQLLHYLYIIIG